MMAAVSIVAGLVSLVWVFGWRGLLAGTVLVALLVAALWRPK